VMKLASWTNLKNMNPPRSPLIRNGQLLLVSDSNRTKFENRKRSQNLSSSSNQWRPTSRQSKIQPSSSCDIFVEPSQWRSKPSVILRDLAKSLGNVLHIISVQTNKYMVTSCPAYVRTLLLDSYVHHASFALF
jgi:hypothetical protein